MESIYQPELFRSSENFPVKSYFNLYGESCQFEHLYYETKDLKQESNMDWAKIKRDMNMDITNKTIQHLEKICSISQLTVPDEPEEGPANIPEKLQTRSKLEPCYPITNRAEQLTVIKSKKTLDEQFDIGNFKFGSKRFLKTATMLSNKSLLSDILPGSGFIFTIMIYRPFSINYGLKNSTDKMRVAYEIEALGTSTLADVADKISCVANIVLFKEVESTNADLRPLMNARGQYPSQSIFIDGVFYNDHRSPEAINYSSEIIEWAKMKNIGTFTNDHMEKTTLDSLQPRFGYPYVYMHQGNCEHIFVFSDARLIQPNDCLYSKKYPRIVSLNRVTNVLCFMCGIIHSKWIVMKCDRFPQEKVFLCADCCNSYLYINGEKVTDFQLYPYDNEELSIHMNENVIEIDS